MKVVIVEDEMPAAEKLERYLHKYDAGIEVVAKLDSVAASVRWLNAYQHTIDLLFIDIQLLDGLSFEIFAQVEVRKPVVFTTAFNTYALDAFKVNSIDYLLKPISYPDLAASMQKLASLKKELGKEEQVVLRQAVDSMQQRMHKSRFMVKVGEHIKSIPVEQIALFYADGREVYLVTQHGRKFIIDYTLEALEEVLSPSLFFRINRTFILHIDQIKDVSVYSNSRLRVVMQQAFDKEIIVSREKVSDFKNWFDGKN